jgi:hypothetical protein
MAGIEEVLDHHLRCFGALDLDGIMADFSDNSVLLTVDGALKGRDAIRGFFAQAFVEFGQPGTTFAMLARHVAEDCALVVWDAETVANKFESATDTFVVRDGMIAIQTFAAKVTPKIA